MKEQSLMIRMRQWSYNRQRLGKQGTDAEQVLKDIIGVYSPHPSGPLSLYARVHPFNAETFYRLDRERLAFRVPAMRGSAYMLSRESAHYAYSASILPPSDPSWEKLYAQKARGLSQDDYEKWRGMILEAIPGPKSIKELKQLVDMPDDQIKRVVNRIGYEGKMLRIGAKSLRSNIISYISAEVWSDGQFVRINETEAQAWLAGEYLRAFGPVRIKDFKWWAGITLGKSKAAFAVHDTVDIGDGWLSHKTDLKDFESFTLSDTDSLDILPQWDTYIMGYAPDGRKRFVSPDMQHHIYGKLGATGGNGLGTILVNGLAHGSWSSRFAGKVMKVTLNMFEKPSSRLKEAINSRFKDIAQLLSASRVEFVS